jgi:antitoxin component YwqK of YwqJK toxin-antitoxin module
MVALAVVMLMQGCQDEPALVTPTPITSDKLVSRIETRWGSVLVTTQYYYRNDSQLDSLVWQRVNGADSRGREVFQYDNGGRLTKKIVSQVGLVDQEIVYTWQNGKIAAAKSYINGVKTSYQLFEYNTVGQLTKIEFSIYDRGSGGYYFAGENLYTYHADGNLFEIKEFTASLNQPQPTLVNTKVYENYAQGKNPLPTMELLPNVVLQKNLPGSYKLVLPDREVTFTFSYSLQADGYPAARVVQGAEAEQNTYTYR